MLPHYNTFHHNSGQAHPAAVGGGNGGSSAPSANQQQGMPFNPLLANSCNMLLPSMQPQQGFMNLPNNHMRMPMSQFGSFGPMSQLGQPSVGFCGPQNMGQFFSQVNPNMGLLPAPFLGNNLLSLQQMNQNIGPYGQFSTPNLMNRNQIFPQQMQNPFQGGPNYVFGGSNQAPQVAVVQNPALFANPNFGNVHSPNQGGQQNNQNQQNYALQGIQGNNKKPGGVHNSNFESKNSPRKSFAKHPKRGLQQPGGFQNSKFHHTKNAKGKIVFQNGNKGKGPSNDKEINYTLANSMNQDSESKRCLSLSYTEQEIQLWREERKKNFPSNTNIEKKLSQKKIDSEAIQREARARREQLKEILTKQAEMGVEVAEIPSHYLSDSEKQGYGREENRSRNNNRGSQKKFNKRDRYDKKDRFAKRQRSSQKNSSNDPAFCKREPTLLQKLFSSDMKRDKSRLQQVFRFMVTNSFFKDYPDKPLKFPTVVVQESVADESVLEELSSVAGKGDYVGRRGNSEVEVVGKNEYDDFDYNDDHGEDENEKGMELPEEEEGEIIN